MRQLTMMPSIHALFNENYLPPKLLHRDKELTMLSSLFSIEEEASQSVNVLVHGAFGIGRTTLLRFFGQDNLPYYKQPFIRFQQKQSHEILSDILQLLAPNTYSVSCISEQWALLKRLIRKTEIPMIFTFDDVDRNSIEIYGKLLQVCKENGTSSMTTAPRYFPRLLKSEVLRFLDVTFGLEPFSDNQFLDIVQQRVQAVFPPPVPQPIMEFMADLICLLDFQRPATVVELLQNLHPFLSYGLPLTADAIRQACLHSRTLHYDFWSEHLSSFSELDVTTMLLLQAIGQYFINHPSKIYVTKFNLFNQYQQVGESIGFLANASQFSRALNTILFQDLLLCSRYNTQNYYTLLPAEGYLEIVELLLGEYSVEQ